MTDWDLEPGTRDTRQAIQSRFGGNMQKGITRSTRSSGIQIYSDPSAGHAYGYTFDGWGPDGAFYYTGDGTEGDQTLDRDGNKALMESLQTGEPIRVFIADPEKTRGGKIQTYLGEFYLDPEHPCRAAQSHSRNSVATSRRVFVFRLLPTPDVVRDRPVSAVAQTQVPVVTTVAPDDALAIRYDLAAKRSDPQYPNKAELTRRLKSELVRAGHTLSRLKVSFPSEENRTIMSDLYDETTGELFSIRGAASRGSAHSAIGQLFDYRRHLSEAKRFTVVMPTRPSADVEDLLEFMNLGLMFLSGDSLVRAIS